MRLLGECVPLPDPLEGPGTGGNLQVHRRNHSQLFRACKQPPAVASLLSYSLPGRPPYSPSPRLPVNSPLHSSVQHMEGSREAPEGEAPETEVAWNAAAVPVHPAPQQEATPAVRRRSTPGPLAPSLLVGEICCWFSPPSPLPPPVPGDSESLCEAPLPRIPSVPSPRGALGVRTPPATEEGGGDPKVQGGKRRGIPSLRRQRLAQRGVLRGGKCGRRYPEACIATVDSYSDRHWPSDAQPGPSAELAAVFTQ